MIDIYKSQNIGTPYILSSYKKALLILEDEGKIKVDKSKEARPKRNGQPTLGDDRVITFK